jgi:predicted ester cyclase
MKTGIDNAKLSLWRMVNEGFLEGNMGVAFEICHADYRNDTSVRAVPFGPEGLNAHIRNARSSIERFDLRILDILAEGDRAALIWQTRGTAGSYVGHRNGARDTSAWLIAHFRFVDGLIYHHVINWEPLRLMIQAGMNIPPGGADLTPLALECLRYEAYPVYPQREIACEYRRASAGGSARDIAVTALTHSWGGDARPPEVAPDAYFSFADLPDCRGREGLRARRDAATSAFSNPAFKIVSSVEDGDRVILRWTLSCINGGEWLGQPATRRSLSCTGSTYARIEQGRIAMWVELVDVLTLLRQNGSLSAVLPGCFPDQ